MRLRTTATSGNGVPSVASPGSSLTTALTHVMYTRDATGLARIYLDGVQAVEDTVKGTCSNWSNTYQFALAN